VTTLRDQRLDKLYARLPKLDCKRQCFESCGPIMFAPAEWERMSEHVGFEPAALPGCVSCPLLSAAGACTVYAIRPIICRLFGLVKRLACPFGCQPERWVTDDEAFELLDRVWRILDGPVRSPFAGLDRSVSVMPGMTIFHK
jgi:uncharacterized protein